VVKYRYTLARSWAEQGPIVLFVGLNPSTADDIQDDPTLRRCMGFAQRWGYGGLRLVNLYAARATDPNLLATMSDPVGPDNDEAIVDSAAGSQLIVAAWGNQGHASPRAPEVLALLDREVHCLEVTARGAPKHPLYARAALDPAQYYPSALKAG